LAVDDFAWGAVLRIGLVELLEELREGAVEARPLEEADEEGVEENLRITLLVVPLFSVEVEGLFVVLDVFSDLTVLDEEEGNLLVTAERLGTELLDVTGFCESGVNLLMARVEIPEFVRLELDDRTDVDFTRER
jgi:hypothetical protein